MTKWEILQEMGQKGPFRASDVTARGITRSYLQRWRQQGLIERVGYGLYRLADGDLTEMATVAEVVRKAPHVHICLITALAYHELTTEIPHAVWIMVEGTRRAPRIDFVGTEVVRASGDGFSWGIEEVQIEGVLMKITDPAKTVADCFRYRSHVGLDVAYAALRDFLDGVRRRRGSAYSIPHLVEAAKVDRVYNVMRPSLEVLV